ncbi:MAG: tRNA (adenosine(37)-N6)-dimethylallyltransferase MiaA [Acidobacteriaceae bacterium]|nr:tRNA (adenosine(37)-N6)-dimethylallyltransferase MiaA [Acidobacteriaceae bacterium]
MESAQSPLIAVLGPTGAGKSELAIFLAQRFQGEIVSCDSVQVYRGLDIGAAKVSVEQRREVPHHLLDVLDLDRDLTAGAYARLARTALTGITDRGKLPIIVGGTGFYLRALLDGLSPAASRDEQMRVRLTKIAQRNPGALYRFLRRGDPQAAGRIHPNDHQKLIRAIELSILERQPVTETQRRPREALRGFKPLKIGLNPNRSELYSKLNVRSASMFRSGLIEEIAATLNAGFAANLKPLQSLGYKQGVRVLRGECSLEEAIRECQIKTRQYAKRQMTWFRADPAIHWMSGFGTDQTVQRAALVLTADFLGHLNDSP